MSKESTVDTDAAAQPVDADSPEAAPSVNEAVAADADKSLEAAPEANTAVRNDLNGRDGGPSVNEAVRASLMAVKAARRAAQRRQLRDRLMALGATALTAAAIWGAAFRSPQAAERNITAPTAIAEAPAGSVAGQALAVQPQAAQANDPSPGSDSVEPIPDTAANPEAPMAETAPLPKPVPSPAVLADAASECAEALEHHHWVKIAKACPVAFEQKPDAQLALTVAQALHRRGRIAEAATWAERVLDLDPQMPEAFVIVAHAAEQTGEAGKAATAYRQYLSLAPRGWHAVEARRALASSE